MILLIILFFIVGIISIMLEAVIPHGLSAIFGFLIIGVSAYVAYLEFGLNLAIVYCIMALFTAIIVTRTVFRSGLRWMALKPPRRKPDPVDAPPAPDQEPRVGDLARVVAPLRPTGAIEVRGRRVSARTVTPEVEFPIGATVEVISRDSIYWIVQAPSAGGTPVISAADPS